MPCPLLIFSQSGYLIWIFAINSHNGKQCRSRSVGFFRSQQLNLHCLPKQGISGFSRTRVKCNTDIHKPSNEEHAIVGKLTLVLLNLDMNTAFANSADPDQLASLEAN